ncbi:hypothetical protein [Microbacterium sp. NPDC058389]|uniref:hypothetical protein n=1 Tax=Microbacterium sp. NPDC058389 TaxID=3346475 RepID=UPI00364C298D
MNPDRLRRPRATQFPKDRVLVVGSTPLHREYTRWLLRRIDQHPGLFEEASPADDPKQTIRRAAKIARDQRTMGSECQQVWVILDGVTPDEAADLQRDAKAPRVSVVGSTPDLRTWLMLHLADLPEPPTSEALTGALQVLSPTFAQPLRRYEDALSGRYEVAKSRALALVEPSVRTDAYRLVDSILGSSERFHGTAQIGLL